MRLETIAVLGALAMGSASAIAEEPAKPAAQGSAAAEDKVVTRDIKADVVAVDTEHNTLTMKGDAGDKTLPVEGKAVAILKDVKPGAKVILTCTEDQAQEPQTIVDIDVLKADE